MHRISSAEFVRRFSAFCDEARTDPVLLTRNGRDRLVILNVELYRHLLSLALINSKGGEENDLLAEELKFVSREADRGRRA